MNGTAPISVRTKRTIILIALVLPFALIAAGALIAHATGHRAIDGALGGSIATFLLIGSAWIGLGVYGARSELRLRSQSNPRAKGR